MKYLHLATLLLILFVCTPASAQSELPKREVRAVWLTTLNGLDWPKTRARTWAQGEQQKQELCAILDQLQQANINTVLLQTRVRGSVIYPSSIEPWDDALTGSIGTSPGYDPLRFAIDECHRRGMELHAWVVTIPCFKIMKAKQMGARSVLNTHPELCKKLGDMWYLDPGMPGTANYLTRICEEIIQNYDVDGLHFDYIRYPENAASFPDNDTYRRYGQGQSKAEWRRENITRCVAQIYRAVKDIKPWVKVSSSPVGKYSDLSRFSARGWNAYNAVHQDAQGWMQAGIHDMLFPMMYFEGDNFYPFALDWEENSNNRPVVPGLGIYFLSPAEKNWDLSVVTRELHFLRIIGASGAAYFRSQFLTDDVKGIYRFLSDEFYAQPALTPAMEWMDSTPPTTPLALQQQGSWLTWGASVDNTFGADVYYNVYISDRFPVNIDDPCNLKAVRISRTEFDIPARWARGGNFAVTAIDRFGNESEPAYTIPQGTSSRFLSHDNVRLQLPPADAQKIVLTDAFGRTVRIYRPNEDIDVINLKSGMYNISTMDKRGNIRRVGAFVK